MQVSLAEGGLFENVPSGDTYELARRGHACGTIGYALGEYFGISRAAREEVGDYVLSRPLPPSLDRGLHIEVEECRHPRLVAREAKERVRIPPEPDQISSAERVEALPPAAIAGVAAR